MCQMKRCVHRSSERSWLVDFYTGTIRSLLLGILKSPGMRILIEQLAFVMHSQVFQADKLGRFLPCSWPRLANQSHDPFSLHSFQSPWERLAEARYKQKFC